MGQRRNPLMSAVALLLLVGCAQQPAIMPYVGSAAYRTPAAVEAAARAKRPPQTIQHVTLSGTIHELLPTDNVGSRHQQFVFAVAGKLIKVAHNIDLAPVVPLKAGDKVEIKGDLIITTPQDVLHWTHHDPAGRHPDGYILHNGRKYE